MPSAPTDTIQRLSRAFDRILVLTVPRFKDRQERVRERLGTIPFDFFYGYDKQDLTDERIRAWYRYDKKRSLAIRLYFPPLNSGEIACALSHRMIYEAMIANGWQRVLVLEDDVVPDPARFAELNACLDELPDDWELCYFGYLKNTRRSPGALLKQGWYWVQSVLGFSRLPARYLKRRLPRSYSPHLWRAGFHDCTHAYGVSLSAARKLQAAQVPVVHRADNLLSECILKGELTAFASRSFIFNQEVFTDPSDRSTIRGKWGKT
ncbi:MAG: hypothetical protein RJA57_1756 [Bacteroidota bacterium]|jgi:glycosyl transferase family 25